MANHKRNHAGAIETSEDITAKATEIAVRTAIDISKDTESILSMVTKDGFDKKIDLIYSDEDMSTAEKLKAIDAAEDKRIRDVEKATEAYKGIMVVKAGVIISVIVGSTIALTSPEGRRLLKSAFEKVA